MSRTSIYLSLLAGILLIGAWAPVHAAVYRWVDKHGVVHYTDQWHPGAKRIEVATGTSRASGHAASDTTPTVAAGDRAANRQIRHAADQRAVQATETKLRTQRCKKAKAVYHRLIFARRLYTAGKNGQRHYMSDAQANAARVKAREIMNRLCGANSGS